MPLGRPFRSPAVSEQAAAPTSSLIKIIIILNIREDAEILFISYYRFDTSQPRFE
jgi:hypothetical protein